MTKRTTTSDASTSALKLIESLQERLVIDEHGLDDELKSQPQTLYNVSTELALAISRRDAAKQALKEEEAGFGLEYRTTARKQGDKFTEKEVADETDTDDDVIAARGALRECELVVNKLTALKEAYKDRGYALGRLVDLWLASYFESDAAVRKPQQRLKDDRAGKAQQAGKDRFRREAPPWND